MEVRGWQPGGFRGAEVPKGGIQVNKRFLRLLLLTTVCEQTELMQPRSSLALLIYLLEDFIMNPPESLKRRGNCFL